MAVRHHVNIAGIMGVHACAGFYFLIYKHFLPKMSRVLKFRKRKMNTSQEGVHHGKLLARQSTAGAVAVFATNQAVRCA